MLRLAATHQAYRNGGSQCPRLHLQATARSIHRRQDFFDGKNLWFDL
jgi:hypothetical protein